MPRKTWFSESAFNTGFNAGSAAVREKLKKDEEKAEKDRIAVKKAAEKVNTSAKETAVEIMGEQQKRFSKIQNAKSKDEFNLYTSEYNQYNEIAALKLDEAAFNTPEAIDSISRIDLSPKEGLFSATLKDEKGVETTMNLPTSMQDIEDSLYIGEDKAIYQRGFNGDGMKQEGASAKLSVQSKEFNTTEAALIGYDPKGKELYYNTEAERNKAFFSGLATKNKPSDATLNAGNTPIKSLPEVEQKKLLAAGYKITDTINNKTLQSFTKNQSGTKGTGGGAGTGTVLTVGDDGIPYAITKEEAVKTKARIYENPTADESNVNSILQDAEFQLRHQGMSGAEKRKAARKENYAFELENDPKNISSYVQKAAMDFSATAEGLTTDEIVSSYDKLPKANRAALKHGQSKTTIGKDYVSKNIGKVDSIIALQRQADKVMSMEEDEIFKGFGADALSDIINSIPNIFSEDSSVKNKALNNVRAKGALGQLFFTYLNDVNKGAPSNADMAVMERIVTGLSSGTISTNKEAVNLFMNSINSSTKDYYDTNAPYISALARKDYDKLSELKEYKPTKKKKKPSWKAYDY